VVWHHIIDDGDLDAFTLLTLALSPIAQYPSISNKNKLGERKGGKKKEKREREYVGRNGKITG